MIKPWFLAGSEAKFFDFISDLNEKDKIALISHNDLDGMASAAILSLVLGKIDFLSLTGYKSGILKELTPRLKELKINKLFLLDLCLESEISELKEIEKFAKIIIIDHHVWNSDINSDRTVFLRTESRYPATYSCYYLSSKIQTVPEFLAVLGMFSDLCFQYTQENSDRLFLDYDISKLRGDFVQAANNFSSAIIYFEGKETELYEIFRKTRTISDLNKINVYAEKVNSEIDKQLKIFMKNKEVHEDLVIFYMKPKYRITSIISTNLSMEEKDKFFVILSQEKDFVKVSTRMQTGRISCIELLEKAGNGIQNYNFGGHHRAAGAQIPNDSLDKYKKNLINSYKELKNA